MKINAYFHLHLPAIRRLAVTLLAAWGVLLTIFFSTMVAVHFIPREAVMENGERSLQQLMKRPQFPVLYGLGDILKLDTRTDAVMVNMAMNADTSRPFRAAMVNEYYNDDCCARYDFYWYRPGNRDWPTSISENYGRYWQGHQVMLRPMLAFTTVRGITIFNLILCLVLFITAVWLIWRKVGWVIAATFVGFILLSGFPVAVVSLQYVDVFALTFIGVISVLLIPPLRRSLRWCVTGFFVLGALIAFFDFLTFPIISLCYPGVILCTLTPPSRRLRMMVAAVIGWTLGYAILWMSKWIFCLAFLDFYFIIESLLQVRFRLKGYYELPVNLYRQWGPAVISVLIMFSLWMSWRRMWQGLCYLAFAALPVVWFLAVRNHTNIHFFFTWRILVASAFCLAVFYLTLIRQKK